MIGSANVPARAWVVTLAGTAVNLCLGILYAWSVWKGELVPSDPSRYGTAMDGNNAGWVYLSDAQGTWAYAICGITFALFMIPGGRIQDRYGPKLGATLGGLCLAAGCILAGVSKSYLGLVLGFGLLGGIGMGLGYAAATPAAVKWFHSSRRGLVVGIVVSGYGAAAIYIAPLADYLIRRHGLSVSFICLGILFAVVVLIAGRLLTPPPVGYVAPIPPHVPAGPKPVHRDYSARQMLRTWQFYALVLLFIGSAQSGLLVIANAKALLKGAADATGFFATNAWLLATFGGFVNAAGRIGTGQYSDRIGRLRAFGINGLISAACLFAAPWAIGQKNLILLFLVIGVMYWQYGGSLALMPAITADYFGSKNLGLNYGLVFIGWGVAFFIPQLAGYIKDSTGNLDLAFYLSGGLLLLVVGIGATIRKPGPSRWRSRGSGMLLALLFFLLAAHALMDYALQNGTMAACKCRGCEHAAAKAVPWYYWLTAHAVLHGAAVGIVIRWFGFDWPVVVACAGIETVLHGSIDHGKCLKWYGIHVDQALHVACKVGLWGAIAAGAFGTL